MRHEQQRRAMLHKEVTVQGEDEMSVTLDIVPDEFEPYAQLKAFDPYGELLAEAKVSAGFQQGQRRALGRIGLRAAGRLIARGAPGRALRRRALPCARSRRAASLRRTSCSNCCVATAGWPARCARAGSASARGPTAPHQPNAADASSATACFLRPQRRQHTWRRVAQRVTNSSDTTRCDAWTSTGWSSRPQIGTARNASRARTPRLSRRAPVPPRRRSDALARTPDGNSGGRRSTARRPGTSCRSDCTLPR